MGRKLSLIFFILLLPHCRTTATSQNSLKVDTDFSEAHDGSEVIDLTQYITPDSQHTAMEAAVRAEIAKVFGDEYPFKLEENSQGMGFPKDIPEYELIALRFYTLYGYKYMNEALRRIVGNHPKAFRATIKAAVSALNKIKPEPCTAYRGTELPDEVFAQLREGVHYYDPAFLSSSYDKNEAFPRKHKIVLTSNECRKIDGISVMSFEKEVLWAPGSDFLITAMRKEDNQNLIYLVHRHLDKNEKLKSQKVAWDGSSMFLVANSSQDIQNKNYSSTLSEDQSGGTKKASIFFGANGQGTLTLPYDASSSKSHQVTFSWVRQGDLIETSAPGSATKTYYYIFSESLIGQLRAKNAGEIDIAKEVVTYFRVE